MVTLLDDKDLRILELLIEDGRASCLKISKKTKIPTMTVLNRIRKMKDDGVIEHFTTKINYEKVGLGVVAYILVNINYQYFQEDKKTPSELAEMFARYPFVFSVCTVAGKTDILLKLKARSIKELEKLVTTIAQIKCVQKTETLVVLHDSARSAGRQKELISELRRGEVCA